jgi:thymidine kinase
MSDLFIQKHSGKLIIIYGCMFSGKTKKLNQLLYKYILEGKKILKISYIGVKDTERNIETNNPFFTIGETLIYVDKLTDDISIYDKYHVIGIDEGQFFDDNIIQFVKKNVDAGKIIILAGLISDYRGNPFGNIHKLFSFADKTHQKFAECSECRKNNIHTKAIFSRRENDSNQIIDIGNDYIPVCRSHRNI